MTTTSILQAAITLEHICFLQATSKEEAIQELIGLFQASGVVEDREMLYQLVLHREKITSTGIGVGIALPHAKLQVGEEFSIAIGIAKEKGIPWQAIDGLAVNLVFLIIGPEGSPKEYLILLSQLTQILKDESLRKALIQVKDRVDVVKIFAAC